LLFADIEIELICGLFHLPILRMCELQQVSLKRRLLCDYEGVPNMEYAVLMGISKHFCLESLMNTA
jgi:hypothetical protein